MILVVDDDAAVRSSLALLLKRASYEVETANHPDQALEFVRRVTPDLILMDMNYSLSTTGDEGLELLQKVKIFCPDTPVILITAWGSIALAVRGMQLGAFDFVTKPWENKQLLVSIETALNLSERKTSCEASMSSTRAELDARYDFSDIVGHSPALVEVLSTIGRIALTSASVLITGESGTGKELIAEAIHRNSNRSDKPFVKVNLGGISQSLFESEMFGHKRGAFTDAHSDRVGRFSLADGGTIFLDEIGELDLTCQVKLLRVLQDQTFEILGDSLPRRVDVRVVSATNADLAQMVAQKSFREDLFYRINLICIHLPALRQRAEDIPLLAQCFADRVTAANALPRVSFSSEAQAALMQYAWPGNIRELKNFIERIILVGGGGQITAEAISTQLQESRAEFTPPPASLDELQAQIIKQAIERSGGNLSRAARTLGISRAALYRRMEKYNL
ncbi:MAG: sigma-54 dependent transcriptional regulator [Porphyromonadaceae bacterium]|nr:sigma-54 dependent transcriptional regulator [Porphyromonadaceae bacterium]